MNIDQVLRETGVPLFFVPGEHDFLDDGQGRAYLSRYGKGSRGAGWYSFDRAGWHVVVLNSNCAEVGGCGAGSSGGGASGRGMGLVAGASEGDGKGEPTDGIGAFAGPAFDANDLAAHLAAWKIRRG